jgi:hypothetical protein
MLGIALLGTLVAGTYGALHDQVSYSISPEYFTKMKFQQFAYADFGWPPRTFASEIGFLATWWVGLFGGWFVARAGLAEIPPPARRKCIVRTFAIVLTTAALIGAVGALIGVVVARGDLSAWSEMQQVLDIHDLRGFVIVAYLHAAGYLGALAGLILAIVYVRRCLTHSRSSSAEAVVTPALRS